MNGMLNTAVKKPQWKWRLTHIKYNMSYPWEQLHLKSFPENSTNAFENWKMMSWTTLVNLTNQYLLHICIAFNFIIMPKPQKLRETPTKLIVAFPAKFSELESFKIWIVVCREMVSCSHSKTDLLLCHAIGLWKPFLISCP